MTTKLAMPSVAEQLRNAREMQKLSVYDVAEATKIKTDHVRALDEGDYDAFPAPVYIRGFVRTYAALVKLDVSKVMQDLEAELSQTKDFSQPPSLVDRPQGILDYVMLQISKVNWLVTLIIGGLGLIIALSIVGYRSWRSKQSADPLANLGPGLYRSAHTNAGEVLPIPGSVPPR